MPPFQKVNKLCLCDAASKYPRDLKLYVHFWHQNHSPPIHYMRYYRPNDNTCLPFGRTSSRPTTQGIHFMARSTSLLVRCETHVRMCRIQQSNINFLNSRRDVIQCTALSSYYSTVWSRTYDTIMYWACGASTLSVQPHNLRRRLCDYWGLCFDAQRMLRRRTVGSCRRAACSCAYCNTEHLTWIKRTTLAVRHSQTKFELSVTF